MKKEFTFSKPYDTVLFVFSILKRLGSGKVESFSQRLKSQKIQYFAQLFGVSPSYNFNLYLRGPYSPDLAHDLYSIKDKNIDINTSKFVPEDLEARFNKLKNFLGDIGIRELELASTLHWLLKVANFDNKRAQERLIEWKGADKEELEKAFKLISVL